MQLYDKEMDGCATKVVEAVMVMVLAMWPIVMPNGGVD